MKLVLTGQVQYLQPLKCRPAGTEGGQGVRKGEQLGAKISS